MAMLSIFVPWWPGRALEASLHAAPAIARRMMAQLDVARVQPDTDAGACAVARGRLNAWRDRHHLPGAIVEGQLRSTFARWSERAGAPEQVIVRKGRLSDLTVLGFPGEAGALDRALDAALFETGQPVLLVPAQMPANPLAHVAVAWNGSLEATRAVVGARALLYRAERVSVLTTPGLTDRAFAGNPVAEDLDLAGALRWHGIRAMHREIATPEASAGAALLRAAHDQEVSMLVMGAYTHSRVTAAFLGGVTGNVLQNPPPFPVLLAH